MGLPTVSHWILLLIDWMEVETAQESSSFSFSFDDLLERFLSLWFDLEVSDEYSSPRFQQQPPLLKWIYLIRTVLLIDRLQLFSTSIHRHLHLLIHTYSRHPSFFDRFMEVMDLFEEHRVLAWFRSLLDLQFNVQTDGNTSLLALPFLSCHFPMDFWMLYWHHVVEHQALTFEELQEEDWVWPGGRERYRLLKTLKKPSDTVTVASYYLSALQRGVILRQGVMTFLYDLIADELNYQSSSR